MEREKDRATEGEEEIASSPGSFPLSTRKSLGTRLRRRREEDGVCYDISKVSYMCILPCYSSCSVPEVFQP